MFVLVSLLARAAPLVPSFDATHSWKIEVYSYEPATDPYASDHRDTEMQVTAVTLTCKPSGRPHVDHCTPVDGRIYWGYRLVGAPDVTLHELTTAAILEVSYNDRGRVLRYDWLGDRSGFWAGSCHALLYLEKGIDPEKRVCTEEGARRWGPRFEEGLTQGILGGLDVELPKGGDHGGKQWKPGAAPMAGRRYLTGVLASSNGMWAEVATGDARKVIFNGQISERPVTGGSVSGDYTTDSVVRVEVSLNAANRPATLEAHAVATSTSTLYGFTQTDTWVTTVDPPVASPPGADPRR